MPFATRAFMAKGQTPRSTFHSQRCYLKIARRWSLLRGNFSTAINFPTIDRCGLHYVLSDVNERSLSKCKKFHARCGEEMKIVSSAWAKNKDKEKSNRGPLWDHFRPLSRCLLLASIDSINFLNFSVYFRFQLNQFALTQVEIESL